MGDLARIGRGGSPPLPAAYLPPCTVATIHRQAASIAASRGWPVPNYWTVYKIVACLDPPLVALAVEGSKK